MQKQTLFTMVCVMWSLMALASGMQERNIVGGVIVPFIEGLDSTVQLGNVSEELAETTSELASTQDALADANSQIVAAELLLTGTAIPDAAAIDALVSRLFDETAYAGSNPPSPLLDQINNGLIPYLQATLEKLGEVGHIQHIAAGKEHTLILVDSGKVYGCGSNYYGELGIGTIDAPWDMLTTLTPMRLDFMQPVLSSGDYIIAIAAGRNYSLALTNNGAVYSCGDNTYGQLGLGTNDAPSVLTLMRLDLINPPLGGSDTVSAIASGGYHSLLLTNEGVVCGCGLNASGRLGIGNVLSPILTLTRMRLDLIEPPLGGGATVEGIFPGSYTSYLLIDDGGIRKIYGVGANNNGELGIGITSGPWSVVTTLTQMRTDLATPPFSGSEVVETLDAGAYHVLVLTNDNGIKRVYGTGDNFFGALGVGTNGDKRTTLTAMNLSLLNPDDSVKAIEAGNYYSLLLTEDSKIYGTGDNEYGQLGIGISGPGEFVTTLTLMQRLPLAGSKPVAIVANVSDSSSAYSLALTDEGAVFGAGYNENGELGLGNDTSPVTTLSAMSALQSIPVLTKFVL